MVYRNIAGSLDEIQKGKSYWNKKLDGLKLVKLFPHKDIGSVNDSSFASEEIEIEAAVSSKLYKISNNNDIGLNSLLLTALKVLLYKSTGENEIIVTSPIYGSSEFNQFVPLRDSIEPDFTLKSVLYKVTQTLTDGYKYQYYPWHRDFMVSEDKNSISEIMLIMDGLHNFEQVRKIVYSNNALSVICKKTDNKLKIKLIYNRELEKLSKAFLSALNSMLEYIVDNFDKKISDCCLVPNKEKNSLLKRHNVYQGQIKTIHDLFKEQAFKTPSKIAAKYRSNNITYADLDKKSNRLAKVIQSYNIAKGDSIVINVESPIDLLIAILGVLKSGCVYIIIEPSTMKEQVKLILEDSQPSLIISDGMIESSFLFDAKIINLNQAVQDLIIFEEIVNKSISDDIACIIYDMDINRKLSRLTVKHAVANDLLIFNQSHLRMGDQDHIAVFAKQSSIEFFRQTLLCLLNGSTLNFFSSIEQESMSLIENYINKNEITAIIIPAIYLKIFNPAQIYTLRKIIIIGQIHDVSHLELWQKKAESISVFGPLEIPGYVAFWKIDGRLKNNSWIIGQQASPFKIDIVDPDNQLQWNGLPGYLTITGNKIRGDLSRHGENIAQNYTQEGQRYQTDLIARYTDNGFIEIIGSIGKQMELNNYWMELNQSSKETIDNGLDNITKKKIVDNISTIWKKLTGLDAISPNLSFLDMGGDSIKILKLVAELQRSYPGKISAADILSYPTINKLTERIATLETNQSLSEILHSTEKSILNGVSFPDTFFNANLENQRSKKVLTYTFSPVTSDGIEEISIKNSIQVISVIITAYLHTLSISSGEKNINIQSLTESNRVTTLSANLSTIHDIKAILVEINQEIINMENSISYSLETINVNYLRRKNNIVVPLLYNASKYQFDFGWTEIFDLILGVRKQNKTYSVTLRFHPRISAEKVKDWFRTFIIYVEEIAHRLQ